LIKGKINLNLVLSVIRDNLFYLLLNSYLNRFLYIKEVTLRIKDILFKELIGSLNSKGDYNTKIRVLISLSIN